MAEMNIFEKKQLKNWNQSRRIKEFGAFKKSS